MTALIALLFAAAPARGAAAMKSVVCKPIDEARGKSGQELAQAIEQAAIELARARYRLAALLPGDPPIACFNARADARQLPMGAR